MSIFSSLLTPLTGLAGSILGGLFNTGVQSHYNREAADTAWERQQQLMSSKHQMEVKDLYAAGLSPILSAHGSTGSMSAPQASGVGPSENPAELARQVYFQTEQLRLQSMSTAADVKMKEAEAHLQNEKALTEATVRNLNTANTGRSQQETQSSAYVMNNLLPLDAELKGAERDKFRADVRRILAETGKLGQERVLLQLQSFLEERKRQWREEHGGTSGYGLETGAGKVGITQGIPAYSGMVADLMKRFLKQKNSASPIPPPSGENFLHKKFGDFLRR
ncbi:MAG: DNA pilot protein [Arizlama microvirus]|nr:MAG: DNA pilot protein [Arizlama microvirus]